MSVTELETLKLKWLKKTGEYMPPEIADLQIEKIRLAVEMASQGHTVFVPRLIPIPEAAADENASMQEWDSHGELT